MIPYFDVADLYSVSQWTRRILSDTVQDKSSARTCILRNLLDVDPSDSKKLEQDMTRYECFSEFGSNVKGLSVQSY